MEGYNRGLRLNKDAIHDERDAERSGDLSETQKPGQLGEGVRTPGRAFWRRTRWTTALALMSGAILLFFLLKRFQPGEVLAALAAAGWGILWVAFYRFVPLAVDAAGWRELCPPWAKSRLQLLVVLRWIGEAVNTLIPVAQVGGGIVRARLLGQVERDYISAGASTAVDFTIGVFLQAVFTVLGIALLVRAAPGPLGGLYRAFLAVTTFIVAALVVLYMVQRRGLFQKLAAGFQKTLAATFPFAGLQFQDSAQALDEAVSNLYSNRGAIVRCTAWRLLAGFLRTGETWLAMRFLRAPVSWTDALILEGLGTAVRSAVFMVPAGLGAQEGGFVVIGSVLGIAPPLSLALSLVKRAREIIVGVPGLIAWGLLEKRSRKARSQSG